MDPGLVGWSRRLEWNVRIRTRMEERGGRNCLNILLTSTDKPSKHSNDWNERKQLEDAPEDEENAGECHVEELGWDGMECDSVNL